MDIIHYTMSAMVYTPVDQLPPPPKFMLDELEREESKYLGELLSKVLTIREARHIKMALMQKLNTHPIVNAVRESTEKRFREREAEDDRLMERVSGYNNPWKKRNGYDGSTPWGDLFLIFAPKKRRRGYQCRTLEDSFNKNILNSPMLRFQSGKRKGEISPKKYRVAEEIINMWYAILSKYKPINHANNDNYILIYYESMYDKYLQLGFYKFFEINFNKWKNLPESHHRGDINDYKIWDDELARNPVL